MTESSAVVRGFAEPVAAAQGHFRALLDAMAHPGRIVRLDGDLPEPPPPLAPAAFALALALVDFETPIWLDESLRGPLVVQTLRFHCGAPIVEAPERAAFAFSASGAGRAPPPPSAFAQGTPDYPDRSTTLLLEVEDLGTGFSLSLRGPGIEGQSTLRVAGPSLAFWEDLGRNHRGFPLGIDLVLVDRDRIAALPRSTAVGLD